MSANPQIQNLEPILLREDRDSIATLTLNRPERKNALSYAMLERMSEIVRELRKDRSARVVLFYEAFAAPCAAAGE